MSRVESRSKNSRRVNAIVFQTSAPSIASLEIVAMSRSEVCLIIALQLASREEDFPWERQRSSIVNDESEELLIFGSSIELDTMCKKLVNAA